MSKKQTLVSIFNSLGLNKMLFLMNQKIHGRKHIRVVNYHGTPPKFMKNFEKQLQFYKVHYCNVTYKDLENFSKHKSWDKNKPGLIISFDDGHRSNYDFAKPLLEKYGFTGWFFIPPGCVEYSLTDQAAFVGADKSNITPVYRDGRYMMNWDEIKKLYKEHVVGNHTYTHHRMQQDDVITTLNLETRGAKKLLEEKIGSEIDIFCWVGGEEKYYTQAAARMIKASGHRYSFMSNTFPFKENQSPLQINRTNIEAENSLALVTFQLGLMMDMLYYKKRKRVNALTKI